MNDGFQALIEEAGEHALTPADWRQTVYKLNEGPVGFGRRRLLSGGGDCAIESFDLEEGAIRIGGQVGPHSLFIALIESKDMRLMGARASGQTLSLALHGGAWNMVATAPSGGVTLCVGGDALRRVLSTPPADRLRGWAFEALRPRSLATIGVPACEELRETLTQSLALARDGQAVSQEARRRLLDQTARLLGDCADFEPLPVTRGELARHRLALDVEMMLWRADRVDLDMIAAQMAVSRRKVQLAVEEHFNASFTNLSRFIRLHKVRRAMLTSATPHENIADLARRLGFDHYGRFSRYYSAFFGVTPRKDKKFILSQREATGGDVAAGLDAAQQILN